MNLFISFSGPRSHAVARALHDWIPNVIQSAAPFLSGEDIDKGARWREKIAGALQDVRFGITCLTPENLTSPWIHFEAGALSKYVEGAYLCVYLVGLQPKDVEDPLAQFQFTKAEATDTLKMMTTLNRALGGPLSPERLKTAFDRWWPELEKCLDAALKQPASKSAPPERKPAELLPEILERVRGLEQSLAVLAVRLDRDGSPVSLGSTVPGSFGHAIEALDAQTLELLALLSAGHGDAALAANLGMSIQTVSRHLDLAARRLGLHDAATLRELATAHGDLFLELLARRDPTRIAVRSSPDIAMRALRGLLSGIVDRGAAKAEPPAPPPPCPNASALP